MQRLLVIGYGDIARRATPALVECFEVTALVRAPGRCGANVNVVMGDLDDPARHAAGLPACDLLLYLAPPPEAGDGDTRLRNCLAAFAKARMVPQRFVYISTSGVYGDCGGVEVDETRPVNPQTQRAQRRVDAEQALQDRAATTGAAVIILRVPGIYAADRLPLDRLRQGTPVLRAEDDVYTNHIHADDLAALCVLALAPGAPAGVYNASDDSRMKMGDYFDLVADRHGLPRPPRVSREAAAHAISPGLLSFMSESRQLVNARMRTELGMVLRYPTVYEGVPDRRATGARG